MPALGLLAEKAVSDEVENSLSSLCRLATNWECVPMILDALAAYIRGLLPLMEQRETPALENGVNGLFNQLVQTCYEQLQGASTLEAKRSTFLELSKLLGAAFELLKGKQSMHFTALSCLNRIIDMCIIHGNYETGSVARTGEASSPTTGFSGASFEPAVSSSNSAPAPSAASTTTATTTTTPAPAGDHLTGAPVTQTSSKRRGEKGAGWESGGGGGGGSGGGVEGHGKHGTEEGVGHHHPLPRPHHHQNHKHPSPLHRTQSSCLGRIPSLGKRRSSLAVPHADGGGPPNAVTPATEDLHKDDPDPGKGGVGVGGASVGVGSVCVNRTPLEILLSVDPGQVTSVLHNSITMHKRIIGTRQRCTPGVRWQHCTHHCLQILSARVLIVMCHSPHVQHQIVSAGHLKPLVEALDPNHDPHLLCLLLQTLACLALNPSFHASLNDAEVSDMLMQLLLPSDEWYYTNHSTKYAKFVKYHAARILVYMGLFHKLGGRVDLFDRRPFKEANTNSLLQVHSLDDSFIELMAMGRIIRLNDRMHLQAASVEGLVAELIQEAALEERDSHTPYIHLSNSLSSLAGVSDHDMACHFSQRRHLISPFLSPSDSMEFLHDLNHQSFREYVFSGLPMVVHPIIILRLLAHKLFGNMIRRKTLTSDTKLKPPKVDDKMPECPPRRELGPFPPREEGRDSLVRKRNISHPCPPITPLSHPLERDDTIYDIAEVNETSSTPGGKPAPCHNHVQSKNGSTKLALKSMVESLVTPLDLTVISHNTDSVGSPPVTASGDPPDSGNEMKNSSSRTFFRWSSKKRLSKSHANVAVLTQQDSLASQDQSTSSSVGDVDIAAFQRELINLPTFVMDTPPMDVSPVFSRCSSVPENLAARNSKPGSTVGGSSGKLEAFEEDTDSEHNAPLAKFVLSEDGAERLSLHGGHPESLVTITTTNMDYASDDQGGPSDVDSPTGEGEGGVANIVVHFEAPSSPQPSTTSQSPDAVHFQFPPASALPPTSASSPTTHNNFLSPHQEYGATTFGFPGPSVSSSTHTMVQSPLTVVSDRASVCTLRPAGSTATSDIPAEHRGVLKVFETWVSKGHIDLDGNSVLALETRDFLRKLSVLGHDYKAWCQKMGCLLHVEECIAADKAAESKSDGGDTHTQYKKHPVDASAKRMGESKHT
ncbi:hypothetical protein ACOMHN_036554 [Nucella lapillus]